MNDVIEMVARDDLVLVLDALGVPWTEGQPANGTSGTVLVQLDGASDGRLEDLVGDLSELRWKYEPGRRLQLALPGV